MSVNTQAQVADQCHVAESFFDRLRGLIGRKGLAQGEGMLFLKCNSIHTWMMSFSIDVVFLNTISDSKYEVVSVVKSVRPWKLFPVTNLRANHVLELGEGSIERIGLNVGETLCLS